MRTIDRHFWRSMIYGCDRCDYEAVFVLEDGCEGPGGGNRARVPVPFVARRCPVCEAADVHPGSGYLRHVRWDEDAAVDLTVRGEPDQPYFAYPSRGEFKRLGERACGRPVIPESTHRGVSG